ncbi:hypothetical protein OROGR_008665 [Orobanche gracilis]
MFKVHNLRAVYEKDGNIIHINRTPPPEPSDSTDHTEFEEYEMLRDAETGRIKADLFKRELEESELEELWYEETGNTNFMWGHGSLKHSNFSLDEGIPNYGYTLYSIAQSILQGTNGQPGLGDFLANEGFKAGRYYDVADLLVSLKKFFGVEAYPTFFKHGGYHPSLFEIALLLSKDGTKRLDHPMAAKAPKGKFLMRKI